MAKLADAFPVGADAAPQHFILPYFTPQAARQALVAGIMREAAKSTGEKVQQDTGLAVGEFHGYAEAHEMVARVISLRLAR